MHQECSSLWTLSFKTAALLALISMKMAGEPTTLSDVSAPFQGLCLWGQHRTGEGCSWVYTCKFNYPLFLRVVCSWLSPCSDSWSDIWARAAIFLCPHRNSELICDSPVAGFISACKNKGHGKVTVIIVNTDSQFRF